MISFVSSYFTLKVGDVLFTGTPSGVGRVQQGDCLEGLLEGEKLFTLKVK
jgi:2-keto-4-pentenoate hydratase/2-oxohepta-3-ene-1,7-dioic acid hydratase in catechol pathway